MVDKIIIDVSILIEVDEDKVFYVLDNLMNYMASELKCHIIKSKRVSEDKIRVNGEFCNLQAGVDDIMDLLKLKPKKVTG